jgi:hypothetical protein
MLKATGLIGFRLLFFQWYAGETTNKQGAPDAHVFLRNIAHLVNQESYKYICAGKELPQATKTLLSYKYTQCYKLLLHDDRHGRNT